MFIGTIGDNCNIKTLAAGDALSFTVRMSSYPASLWDGQFVLVKDGNKVAAFACGKSVDDHLVALDSSETSTLKVGRCQAFMVFTLIADSTQRNSVDCGLLTITPNPLGRIPQTPSQLALQQVLNTISIVVSQPEATSMFEGHSYSLHNIKDLYDIRDRLKVQVDNELRELGIPTKGSGFKQILTRFR